MSAAPAVSQASSKSGDFGTCGAESEARQALLDRPALSLRLRIVTIFVALFALMTGITVAAVFFVVEVQAKQAFLEKLSNYEFEIQQARRFEKNFFLYRTNLSDAVASVETAGTVLSRSAPQLLAVAGADELARMNDTLARYRKELIGLLGPGTDKIERDDGALIQSEARLRAYGAQIVSDAQDLIDRERLAMHSLLHTSLVVAVAFLILMSFVMVAVAIVITGAILKPLGRFTRYASRIGAGDYSLITPARKYRDEFCDLALAFNHMLCELKLRQDQLTNAAKMAAIGSLTSGIAHELNNPLNNIALTVETLTDDFADLSDDQKLQMLRQMYTQVERASLTVRDLLDFTREDTPAQIRVSVREIIESTVKLIGNELNLNEIQLTMKFAEALPPITGNPSNLQQLFINLFINSIHAMPDGGTLTVEALQDGGFVRVAVTDTGVGIPAENLERIFDPFFTTKEVGQGTGLGLCICQGIVKKHKGRITVESIVGKGTTFSVFLPVRERE